MKTALEAARNSGGDDGAQWENKGTGGREGRRGWRTEIDG